MTLNLLNFFQLDVQLKLLKEFNDTEENRKQSDLISQQIKEINSKKDQDIKVLEKQLSSILDLLENSKNNQVSIGQGFNLSKKIIKETNFDLFLNYMNYLCLNKETHEKANDILIYIVNLLDYNSKIHSINFYDYSSVKITCLFMKLNLDFLNISTTENDEILLDSLINIQQEIEQLEIFNYTNINNNSNFENIDSGMANVNIILNQLPILKCYLIHWNLLLFVKISQDGDQDNLQPLETQFSNNLLRNIEKYLELVCNQEYFKNLKNFEYIVKFVCIFFLISKKEKYKNRILELSSDFLNKLETSVDICIEKK